MGLGFRLGLGLGLGVGVGVGVRVGSELGLVRLALPEQLALQRIKLEAVGVGRGEGLVVTHLVRVRARVWVRVNSQGTG